MADVTREERRALAGLLLVALVVLGAGIGLRDPWPADEPRFALAARTMVETGDWLFPRRGSELYADKPPMLMWLQAAAYAVTGELRIAFLLPSLVAGLVTVALTWDIGRRLFTPRAGLLSAIGVLSAFMFTYQFKRAQIDPLVTMLITMANWGLLRHLLDGPHWRAWWLGCLAAGLGVATKGVGVIALLMLVPYLVARRRAWRHLTGITGRPWRWAAGGLAFVLGIGVWIVPMVTAALQRGTPEYAAYVHDILLDQTARRYAGQVGGHTGKGYGYFVPVVLLHFLPLSLAYLGAWREIRQAWAQRDGRYALLLGWCVLVLLFFSLAAGKREVYVLPVLPMLAVALGPTLVRIIDATWLKGAALACTLLLALGFGALGLLGLQPGTTRWSALLGERGLTAQAQALSVWLLAIGGAALVAAAAWRLRAAVTGLMASLAGLWIAWGLGVSPLLNDAVTSAAVMRAADRVAGPTGEIGVVAWREQNVLMSPRPPRDFGFQRPFGLQLADAVAWMREAPDRRWVFTRSTVAQACVPRERATVLGHANRLEWWMFQSDAWRPGCLARVSAPYRSEDDAD